MSISNGMDDKNNNKNNLPKEFGNIINTLHNKSKLPSLRTYQGDMAEFIKDKGESVISIAVKEKEKKQESQEKQEKEEKEELIKDRKEKKDGFQINLTIFLSSFLLIIGALLVSFYIFEFVRREPLNQVVLIDEIIPYNNILTLANVTNKNLGDQLRNLSLSNGLSIIKISDTNGVSFSKTQDLFNFLGVFLPSQLLRTLKDNYALGAISQNGDVSYFMIMAVNDFGVAFSAMLDWENNMPNDLSFLENDSQIAPLSEDHPLGQDSFIWKDIIIKNKDTRAFVDKKEKSNIAYTFLDKNTILITNNLSAISEISSIYASRSVVR